MLIGVEICLTGSPAWNAQQCLKACSVEGVEEVIVACEDAKLLKAIDVKLRECDQLGLYRKKVRLRLVSEFMPVSISGNERVSESGTECGAENGGTE